MSVRQLFLGLWPYAPNGFIWDEEQRSQDYTLRHNMRTIANGYAYYDAVFADGVFGDDASRGGNPYWFFPDTRVGMDERHWVEQQGVNEAPIQEWSPNMSQLSSAIHQSITELWQKIALDQDAGIWGGPQ